jgi:hypothetical protein
MALRFLADHCVSNSTAQPYEKLMMGRFSPVLPKTPSDLLTLKGRGVHSACNNVKCLFSRGHPTRKKTKRPTCMLLIP